MSARIVLVDDDDGVRQVAELSLQMLGGHQVLAFGSGEAAVRDAASFAPELLVLDVSMPHMSGPDVLGALRRQPALQQVPAIFLTAKTQAKEVEELLALGAADVVAKPFDPAHLCARVQQVLAGRPKA